MMADNLQKSLDSMSLNANRQQQQQQQQGRYSINTAAMQSPPVRTNNYVPGNSDSQSASARFERFFNNQPIQGNGSSNTIDQQLPNSYQHQTSSSLGPGSSAAGLASNGVFGSFGHNFGTGGNHGAFNNNAMSGNQTAPALRTKTSNIRLGIPSQWNVTNTEDMYLSGSPTGGYSNGLGGSSQAFTTTSSPAYVGPGSQTAGLTAADDDIIPTAIVVKNIPFSVKKEQLLQIIEDLHIPMPYAFNYHFDQGVFRGLAFANFRSGEEADAVVAALNGFDVSGRKLRVEYKKVLQAGEKERIEKEKAIKRMQSMQMEKEREKMRRQTVSGASTFTLPPRPTTESDLHHSDYNEAPANIADTEADAESGGVSEVGSRKEELDLNDPATLEIYSRVLLFKDDRMRDELSFSKNLTASERRVVHMVSKKLGLYHHSLGESEERHVIVTKHEVEKGQKVSRSPASTIGRSGRSENNGTSSNGMLAPGSSHTTGRSGLKMKKSAPDMKRPRDRGDEESFGGLSNNFIFGAGSSTSNNNHNNVNSSIFASNGSGALSRKSNGNLREGYSATMGRRPLSGNLGGAAGLQSLFSSQFDVPPVPSLPINPSDSQSPLPSPIGGGNSNNGSYSAITSQQILRQPAGPGGNNRNFAQRSRVPLSSAGMGGTNRMSNGGYSSSSTNGYDGMDDRFGTLGNLTDDDARTHELLEV